MTTAENSVFGTHTYIHEATTNLIMERGNNGRIHIRIYADSRGSWLGRELNRYSSDKYFFTVLFKRGARLADLWELIEYDLLLSDEKIDFIMVYGGICDLTLKYRNSMGRITYWPHEDMEGSFKQVKIAMMEMVNNLKMIRPGLKLCFLPEAGADLLAYNGVMHPVPYKLLIVQETFEVYLRDLQFVTRLINTRTGATTPWSLDATHRWNAGKLIPVYSRSFDGLHLTHQQVKKLASLLTKYAREEIW